MALMLAPAACERNDKIVTVQEPKDPAPMAMDTQDASALPTLPGGTYTKPESWVVRNPHEFEAMRFSTADASDTVCTVALLGELDWQPNVDRWEKQVEMSPTSPEALPKLLKPAMVGGINSQRLELQSPRESGRDVASEKRLVVTVVPVNGQFYVFKLFGPINEVKAAQADYDAFLNSIHYGPSATAAAAPSSPAASEPSESASADSSSVPFTWTAPPAWKADPDQVEFRTAGWTIGAGAGQAQITISSAFTASAFDLDANMQQWRSKLGLSPTASGKEAAPVSIQVGGQPAMEIDLTGPAAAGKQPQRMIVAFVGNQSLYFFKILGPADLVAQQKPAFDQFLASVQFKNIP